MHFCGRWGEVLEGLKNFVTLHCPNLLSIFTLGPVWTLFLSSYYVPRKYSLMKHLVVRGYGAEQCSHVMWMLFKFRWCKSRHIRETVQSGKHAAKDRNDTHRGLLGSRKLLVEVIYRCGWSQKIKGPFSGCPYNQSPTTWGLDKGPDLGKFPCKHDCIFLTWLHWVGSVCLQGLHEIWGF